MITVSARRLLSAMAVMLMVGSIASASASATEPYIKVEKGGVATTLAEGVTRTQTFSMPAEGRIYIPELSLTVACTNASGSGTVYNNYVAKVRKEGRLKSATITFEGCSVVGKPLCFINKAIGGAAKITTNTIAARLGYQPSTTENIEALIAPEVATEPFTTIQLGEGCGTLEGSYKIKGQLIAGIGPANTFFERSVQGATTVTGSIQQYKTISFPGASETLSAQELKFGLKTASVEGALEIGLTTAGESIGFFTS